jgi:hypothetical protein
MGKTAGRILVIGAILAAASAGSSCGLGAQPEPPGLGSASTGAGGSTNVPPFNATDGSVVSGSGGSAGTLPAVGAGGDYVGDSGVPVAFDTDAAREQGVDAAEAGEIDGGDGAASLDGG